MDDKSLISVWVNSGVRKKIKEVASSEDLNVSSWIRKAIKEKLDRDEQRPSQGVPRGAK